MTRKLTFCLLLLVMACTAVFADANKSVSSQSFATIKQEIVNLQQQLLQSSNPAAVEQRIAELNMQLKSLSRKSNLDTPAVCEVEPVADNCANAILLPVPGYRVGSTVGAAVQSTPNCFGWTNSSAGGVWYKVIGNGSTYWATTCDACTNFDTKIFVYTCGCDNLQCVTINDDNIDCTIAGGTSEVNWCTENGREYWILVDGFGDAAGTFGLSVRSESVACDGFVVCPALGRCCYFSDSAFSCAVTYPDRCAALGGEFAVGETCDVPCPAVGDCGPMDLVFVVDTTGSMGGSINSVVAGLPNIIALANVASGGDLQIGLVTFGDQVSTLQQLAGGAAHIAAVQASITGLTAGGGNNTPEASDEALLEVLTRFAPGSGCTDGSEFLNGFRPAASKIIVLITDAPPAGCDDNYGTGVDDVQAHNVALVSAFLGVRICAVYVPSNPFDAPTIVPIMQDYAVTTAGSYIEVGPDGSGTGGAINSIIANCGQGELQVSSVPVDVRCDNGVVVPNPVTITVNLANTGTSSCDSVVVTLDNGAGPGGTGTVISANPFVVGSIPATMLVSPWFIVTLNANPAGGLICFRAHVESSTCGSNFIDICIDVPPCGDCIPDERVVLETVDPTGMPIPNPHACAHLHPGFDTQIAVIVSDPSQVPVIFVTPGCYECGDSSCVPLQAWTLGTWVFNTLHSAWVTTITPVPGVTGCCVCIRVDRLEPVELTSFTAIPGESSVTVNWSTATETVNDHFDIMRNGALVTSVPSLGNGSQGHSYSWTDNRVANGTTYSYSLVAVSLTGARQDLGSVNATPNMNAAAVVDFALHQNFPNPFNPSTEITFDMKDAGLVTIKVYNMIGQEVATLVNNNMTVGRHTVSFNATNLPSGLYVYKMETQGFKAMNKMLFVK